MQIRVLDLTCVHAHPLQLAHLICIKLLLCNPGQGNKRRAGQSRVQCPMQCHSGLSPESTTERAGWLSRGTNYYSTRTTGACFDVDASFKQLFNEKVSGAACCLAGLRLYIQGWPKSYIYGVSTVFLAGKSVNVRSYTVYIYMVLANPICIYGLPTAADVACMPQFVTCGEGS